MFSKTLDPKIMGTMLPPDFPAEKLSQPRYKMIVDKDVMIPMRDGVMIAANIYRPDAQADFRRCTPPTRTRRTWSTWSRRCPCSTASR